MLNNPLNYAVPEFANVSAETISRKLKPFKSLYLCALRAISPISHRVFILVIPFTDISQNQIKNKSNPPPAAKSVRMRAIVYQQ
jgi:hypothetical protein